MKIIKTGHLNSDQRSAILRKLVCCEKIPFKILVEPSNDTNGLMVITGFEFKTAEKAAEMKLKYI